MEIDETCDCDECTEKRERRAVKPRADLIAAGVLVPVPDGEALPFLDFVNISGGYHIMHDGRVLHVSGPCVFDERGHVDAAVCMDTIVQPVRLVKLEDVE